MGAALQNVGLAPGAEAGSPREDICNDGRDNNNDGRRDSEDPGCSGETVSQVVVDDSLLNISTNSGNAKGHFLSQKVMVNVTPTAFDQNTTSNILISQGEMMHDPRTMHLFQYAYLPDTMTIKEGSKVVWVNEDTDQIHGLSVIDKISGRTIFSYPVIQSSASAAYHFQEAGEFIYSDPMFPFMSGEIRVIK